MLKRDWKIVDSHVSKTQVSHGESFPKLISFLDTPIKSSPDRDIYMTRAILQWLRMAVNFTGIFENNTPNEIAQRMFNQGLAFAAGYKKFCEIGLFELSPGHEMPLTMQKGSTLQLLVSKAGVPCEMVEGVSKTGQYQPGDTHVDREEMKSRWNKVFLIGKWWPVSPRWVLRVVKGADSTPEVCFNDFWFLTDPEIFIQKCYPDNPDDQMLPEAKRVRTPRHFMKLPYLTPVFYRLGLRMTSEQQCVVEAINGECRISFKADNNNHGKNLVCEVPRERIVVTDRKGNAFSDLKTALKGADVSELVFCSRKKTHFMIDVRCPVEGFYSLSVHGVSIDADDKKILMKVKILCREKMEDFRPFPAISGNMGWGFGPVAVGAGLRKTDAKEPKLLMQSPDENNLEIKFELDNSAGKSSEFKAELTSQSQTADDLRDLVVATQDARSLKVAVQQPEEGEYALAVLAKGNGENRFKPVCYYMITTLEPKEKVNEEFYDSSDGTSDIDDEIDDLQEKLKWLNIEREKLKKLVEAREAQR